MVSGFGDINTTCVSIKVGRGLLLVKSIKKATSTVRQAAASSEESCSGRSRRWRSGSAKKSAPTTHHRLQASVPPPQVAPAASAAAIQKYKNSSMTPNVHRMLLSRLQSYTRSYQWLDQTNIIFCISRRPQSVLVSSFLWIWPTLIPDPRF